MNKLIFAVGLLFATNASADIVTLSTPGESRITSYYGCETDMFGLVPSDRENSVLFVTCEEKQEVKTADWILPGRYYTPFNSVSVVYQTELFEEHGCNMVSMWKEGNQMHYYFHCYTYKD